MISISKSSLEYDNYWKCVVSIIDVCRKLGRVFINFHVKTLLSYFFFSDRQLSGLIHFYLARIMEVGRQSMFDSVQQSGSIFLLSA